MVTISVGTIQDKSMLKHKENVLMRGFHEYSALKHVLVEKRFKILLEGFTLVNSKALRNRQPIFLKNFFPLIPNLQPVFAHHVKFKFLIAVNFSKRNCHITICFCHKTKQFLLGRQILVVTSQLFACELPNVIITAFLFVSCQKQKKTKKI